jgi:IS605 OrfB family transposase
MTWLLFVSDADGLWHAHATIDETPPDVVTDLRAGVIAVDVNVGHLAVTVVDRYGNPTSKLTLGFPPAGTPAGEAAVIIGDSVRALCLLAKSRGYGIACEDLEFSKKKASLREFGKAHARRLSGWSYAKFFALLNARCKRDGIDLAQVNPAFTSVIGKTKYATGRAMSTHHAAALVIGRAAMGFGEKFVAMDGSALTSPARMRPRTERKRWRMIRRLPREVSQETVRTAGSESGLNHDLGLSKDNASVPVRDPGRRRTGSCQASARGAVTLAGQNSVIAG